MGDIRTTRVRNRPFLELTSLAGMTLHGSTHASGARTCFFASRLRCMDTRSLSRVRWRSWLWRSSFQGINILNFQPRYEVLAFLSERQRQEGSRDLQQVRERSGVIVTPSKWTVDLGTRLTVGYRIHDRCGNATADGRPRLRRCSLTGVKANRLLVQKRLGYGPRAPIIRPLE